MNRYNSYYPNMQAAQRQQMMRRQRPMAAGRSDAPAPQPPAAPPSQPPAGCGCGCTNETGCSMDALPVAMAYVSWQNWQNVYDPETALCRGTIFPCLDLPFLAYKGACI